MLETGTLLSSKRYMQRFTSAGRCTYSVAVFEWHRSLANIVNFIVHMRPILTHHRACYYYTLICVHIHSEQHAKTVEGLQAAKTAVLDEKTALQAKVKALEGRFAVRAEDFLWRQLCHL
jgi:hypothetical protein